MLGEGSAFCVGHDLRERNDPSPVEHLVGELIDHLVVRWAELRVPTIAGIHGFALGSGLILSMVCDIRIAASDLTVSLPEVKMGMFPALGGTALLTRIVGPSRASRMILTGERFDVETIADWGLFSDVVPNDDLKTTVASLARTVSQNAPLSMQFAKLSIRDGHRLSLGEAHRQESLLATGIRTSDDRREAMEAMKAGRVPIFRGR